jgi:hypothetical protein
MKPSLRVMYLEMITLMAPYEITSSRYTDELNPGDTIDYEGEEYVVIDSDQRFI